MNPPDEAAKEAARRQIPARTLVSESSSRTHGDYQIGVISPPLIDQDRASFSYTDLDTTAHEIRLICLLPCQATSGIECELILTNLDEKPTYEALSYEWGRSSSSDFRIKLNGEKCTVRENLWWALYYLRVEDSRRTLWIDAICINQINIQERNHQVEQMGRIYSQASAVVVWIGLENPQDMKWPGNDVRLAVDFLHELRSDEIPKHSSRRKQAKYDKDMKLDSRLSSKTNALLALCYRSYWTRLWIIQELMLGDRGIVQCGSISFDLALFQNFGNQGSMWIKFCRRVNDDAAAKMLTSPTIKLFRMKRRLTPSTPLLEVMAGNSEAECGDARDKVFGLLNLCAECCRVAVRPDYSQSFTEICECVLEHHMERHTGGEYCRDVVTKDLFDAIGMHLWEIEPSQRLL